MDSPLPPAPTPPSGSMASNGDRTNNLLNLLKFSGAGQQASHVRQQPQSSYQQPQLQGWDQRMAIPPQPLPAHILAPAPSAADPTGLLAALMQGAHDAEDPRPEPLNAPATSSFGASSPPEDTRAYLLNLLNRPKPSQHDQPLLEQSRPANHSSHSGDSLGDVARQLPQLQRALAEVAGQAPPMSNLPTNAGSFDFESRNFDQSVSTYGTYTFPPTQDSNLNASKLFGYNNSTEDPHASSPHNRTPKSAVGGPFQPLHSAGQSPAGPAFQILKKPQGSPSSSHHGSDHRRFGSERSPLASPEHLRRQNELKSASPAELAVNQTPGTSESFMSAGGSDKNKETVSEAIHDIAEKADREAQEALARAEEEQARPDYMRDLDDMDHAQTEKEFQASAVHAARAIKAELDREENDGLLEAVVPMNIAEEVREIVEEAAAQGIADSWESADQDEIVVIEEEAAAPVKVFNFPMKPWISIALQDGATEPRPQFREEIIMDIARLKKEFDQIDRNLYTATENYMAYGMSKAGGLRVIGQEDGKDAKIFTDTKDRIFNVAMSVTPSDHAGVHREAIIGTGISGTVYWVQIKNGEKDHIEDAHPEQYGFALPPMTSQEGDAPGGVLKTRARTSMIHPEFFAVGRGKSINIIWPSFIMQHNLFKPGHDRVVDTERLAKQCSLKINTGKAGKDFTFSQDDSVVVSLDKSGRVKFWDVRELTAAKDGSDPRAPTPAHTSLEVKEPLLTLTSTPEGEKAWPTSVLLVDKLRPYQKRCALRYMIIGMKQNHTLQLWDLALGKPVQEFNLPHSKESDAVCSVMYHPSTGMLVIGHPTRNSIYFAHLSAPKYNLKSVSQVEYIQRLIAQDSTIPAPDSTAVISGVREYSFANRGILRSLDILSTPAMVQDPDEPTLFELYAMHSKGVACLLVKQAELGWTKDNKVLAPVDAVEAGVVTISKLKPPAAQPADTTHPAHPEEPTASAIRLASRSNLPKDSLLQTTPSQDDAASRRGPESVTPAKLKSEVKEEDTPVNAIPTIAPIEKPERKSRKKKAAAVAAAAALASEPQPNGEQSPRVTAPSGSKPDSAKAASVTMPPNSITQESVESAISNMESRLSGSLASLLNASFKSLHGKIDDGLHARDMDFDERQLKLLDMVSEVLNENTQKVLEALIHEQFTNAVIPAISQVASKAVSEQFTASLNSQVSHSIQKEIHKALPSATHHALQNAEFIKAISDRVSAAVSADVQQEVIATLTSRIAPTFSNIAIQASQRIAGEVQQQYHAEFERANAQRLADANKIDQLSSLVTRLSDTVSTMAAAQSQFQGEFLKFQQLAIRHSAPEHHAAPSIHSQAHSQAYNQSQMQSPDRSTQHSMNHPNSYALTLSNASKSGTDYDVDLEQRIALVDQSIKSGKAEEAMIRWMQSGREQDVFDKYLYKYSPQILRGLPHLVLLSVAATISMELEGSLTREKITWLEMVVHSLHNMLNQMDEEARTVTPKIMNLVVTRVENLFVRISSSSGNDPILKNLSQMIALAKRINEVCRAAPRFD